MSGSSRFAPHSFASLVYKGDRDEGVELRLRLYKRIGTHMPGHNHWNSVWALTMCVILFYFYCSGLLK